MLLWWEIKVGLRCCTCCFSTSSFCLIWVRSFLSIFITHFMSLISLFSHRGVLPMLLLYTSCSGIRKSMTWSALWKNGQNDLTQIRQKLLVLKQHVQHLNQLFISHHSNIYSFFCHLLDGCILYCCETGHGSICIRKCVYCFFKYYVISLSVVCRRVDQFQLWTPFANNSSGTFSDLPLSEYNFKQLQLIINLKDRINISASEWFRLRIVNYS